MMEQQRVKAHPLTNQSQTSFRKRSWIEKNAFHLGCGIFILKLGHVFVKNAQGVVVDRTVGLHTFRLNQITNGVD
eukprot:3784951-Amphidinium_carterae.1